MPYFSKLQFVLLVITCCFNVGRLCAQTDSVKLGVTLGDVTIKSYRHTSALKTESDGAMLWQMKMMGDLPQILGNADPIHYMQMLPHVQTNAEYQSGIHIEGCESSHNNVSTGGVPIYNVNHLLGFFSTFNASHYPSLTLHKSAASAASPNRLGGELTMNLTDEVPDSANGELSVGLISSQGTLRLPLGRRTALVVSARGSYLNLIYGNWLRSSDNQIRYAFYDANLTLLHRFNNRHTLTLDYYGGQDKGRMYEGDHTMNIRATWGNQAGALHHDYRLANGVSGRNSLYATHYRNRFGLNMQDFNGVLPSAITDVAYKGSVRHKGWHMGAELIGHFITPQYVRLSGSFNQKQGEKCTDRTLEASVFADYELPLAPHLKANVGLRGNVYGAANKGWFVRPAPSCALMFNNERLQLRATYALRHQYLFQTGFSDMGMPTEFWLSASRQLKPQWAHSVGLGASAYVLQRRYRISADAFYKRLTHTMEYTGSILDFINTDYELANNVTQGKGHNYGFALMLQKCTGRLTGWVNYTFTQAKRSFSDGKLHGTFPASHERPHEWNAVATFAPNRRWSFGGTFVCASGTPFTAPIYIALINGNLISQYGEHNANRLKAYMRLDLSANYKWKRRGRTEQGINLSLYNVTCRSNTLFYYIKTNKHDQTFAYLPMSFMLKVLPSLSYFCKF